MCTQALKCLPPSTFIHYPQTLFVQNLDKSTLIVHFPITIVPHSISSLLVAHCTQHQLQECQSTIIIQVCCIHKAYHNHVCKHVDVHNLIIMVMYKPKCEKCKLYVKHDDPRANPNASSCSLVQTHLVGPYQGWLK